MKSYKNLFNTKQFELDKNKKIGYISMNKKLNKT